MPYLFVNFKNNYQASTTSHTLFEIFMCNWCTEVKKKKTPDTTYILVEEDNSTTK